MILAADRFDIYVATIVAVPATITAIGGLVIGLKSLKETRKVHSEVVTNHGVRAGDRIEKLNDDVDLLTHVVAELKGDMKYVLRWIGHRSVADGGTESPVNDEQTDAEGSADPRAVP